MKRKIVEIDETKCTGCGLCANACHEGAIAMVDGKAKLVRDDYCDGMGDCLPECPAGAIKIVEREAAAYDEKAVAQRKAEAQAQPAAAPHGNMPTRPGIGGGGCPGKMARMIQRNAQPAHADTPQPPAPDSQLRQWPVQIKLVPVKAPWFDGAKLLVAADCTAYAYASVHEEFMRGRVTLIGCPKLDSVDYAEKLGEIISQNDIKSVTILRMQVPCCGGLQRAAERALQASGKLIPWQVITVSVDGQIVE